MQEELSLSGGIADSADQPPVDLKLDSRVPNLGVVPDGLGGLEGWVLDGHITLLKLLPPTLLQRFGEDGGCTCGLGLPTPAGI